MFENTGWGQGGNQINVSTRFNTSASDTSMLTVGGWNNSLSLRVTPSIGVDQNGNRMYDKNRAFQTALTQDNAKALYLLFEKEIRPHINEKDYTPISVGVPVGRDNKRSIVSLELVPVENSYDIFLVCYTNLDQNNATQEASTFRHRFKKVNGVVNYQAATGQGDIQETHPDLENFLDKLRQISDVLPIAAHGQKYADASSAAYRNNHGGQNNSYGGNNAMNNPAGYNPPAATSNGYMASELPFL